MFGIALMGQLEDLFVKEEHRAQGLDKRLFGELGAIAKERNCGRVEWRVLKVSLAFVTPTTSLPILVVSSTRYRHASSFI
jgi:GNAT superfamily N-acetyltransferase